ncbi:MobC family plasmid mobilization relaxosome protein [Streptomyces alkaliphilus]|uniref:MobC family plasmid mobilization relaxosome protein n=1 Tax=Streptomyces alkaliphilus TaxID=1472722 RepID=UPI0034D24BE7
MPPGGTGPKPARRRLRRRIVRERRVCPRFAENEFADLTRAAAHSSMTVGGYVAEAALAAARADNPEAAVADHRRAVRELMTANTRLAAIGNNLNQLARHLNSGGALPARSVTLRLLDRVRDAIENVDDTVDAVLRR